MHDYNHKYLSQLSSTLEQKTSAKYYILTKAKHKNQNGRPCLRETRTQAVHVIGQKYI